MKNEFTNAYERCGEPLTPKETRAETVPEEVQRLLERWDEEISPKIWTEEENQRPYLKKYHKRRIKTGIEEIPQTGTVLWCNETFRLERTSTNLFFTPKTRAIYKSVYMGKQTRTTSQQNPVMIPLFIDQKVIWFEQQYITPLRERTKQGRFLAEIWKYRNEWNKVLPEGVMG